LEGGSHREKNPNWRLVSRGRSVSLNIYKSDYFSTGQQQAGCYTTAAADVLTPRRRVKKLAGKGMVLICLSGNLGIVFQQ